MRRIWIGVLLAGLLACDLPVGSSSSGPSLQVIENPYEGIEWDSVAYVKMQVHDHVGVDTLRIRAYDHAGYGVVTLLDYSGVRSLNYTWRERRWPADRWLPDNFVRSLKSVKMLIPGAEEVGYRHVVSPLLTRYIQKSEGLELREGNEYGTAQECIDLIEQGGGWSVVAHPWGAVDGVAELSRFSAMEIYSAFAPWKAGADGGVFAATDQNAIMLTNWDLVLRRNPRVRGIAVNDHMGPGSRVPGLTPDIRDSGKLLLLGMPTSLNDLDRMLRGGMFFAARDTGLVKDQFPIIRGIVIRGDSIEVRTSGKVTWVVDANGSIAAPVLQLASLKRDAKYARAEIVQGAVTLYSQAIVLARKPPQS